MVSRTERAGNARRRAVTVALLLTCGPACSAGGGGEKTVDAGGNAGSGAAAGGGAGAGAGGGISIGGSSGAGGLGGAPPPVSWPYVHPDLPPRAPDQFGGPAATSGQPEIVYPLAGSMHAMNLGDITFQWRRGSSTNSVFRIDAAASGDTFSFFVPCAADASDECTIAMPEGHWLNLGYTLKGAEVSLTIAGTNGSGGPVATSAPLPIRYSPEPVRGALYYWAAAERALKRATFGSKKAEPFIVPNSPTNEFGCVACHSVSRDGKTIAFAVTGVGGEDIAAIQTAPTEDPAAPYVRPARGRTPYPASYTSLTDGPTNQHGHNVALSPDGSVAAINGVPVEAPNWPPYLEFRDAKTGIVLGTRRALGDPAFGVNRLAILPEWSPDGRSLAVALADSTGDTETLGCVWTSETCRSSIAILPYQGNGEVGPVQVLVASSGSDYHFYPTWSPDGRYIAFASARWDRNGAPARKSISNPGAVLRLVPVAGGPHSCPGPSCYELVNGATYGVAQANGGGGLQSTWPKFTPFAQGPSGNLMFISFNSKIEYGFLARDLTQLWMFAVDLERLGQGDPSYAPVWLPYQNFTDGSLTPYWTTTLPCNLDPQGGCRGCVGDERCAVDPSTNACHCLTIPQ